MQYVRKNPLQVCRVMGSATMVFCVLFGFTLNAQASFFNHAFQSSQATCAISEAVASMNWYSLITAKDLSTSSDIEGRTYVGGNFVSTASANFASNIGGVARSEETVVIVGDIVAGNPLQVNAGSMRLGGSQNGRVINMNSGGSLIKDPTLNSSTMTNNLQTATADLARLAANNSVTLPSSTHGSAVFNVTTLNSAGIAIFSINGNSFFSNSLINQIELNPGSANTVLINVSGSSIDWTNSANFVSHFTNRYWRARVIWNFSQAQTINFRSHNMLGAILAPNAQLSTSANIDGSTAVRQLNTTSAINRPTFLGDLSSFCSTATAPSTLR